MKERKIKNMRKKIILVISAISVLLFMICSISETSQDTTQISMMLPSQMNYNQFGNLEKALEVSLREQLGENYNEILFKSDNSVKIASELDFVLKNSFVDNGKYPNFFGGMYIDMDGNLVTQIVEDKNFQRSMLGDVTYNKVNSILSKSEIKNVDYSYNELEQVNNEIVNFIKSNEIDNYVANYIDVINNRVVVELEEVNQDTINVFKNNISNTNIITFKKGETNIKTITTVNPGSRAGSCSVGYRAKYGSRTGIVTAGHCAHSGTQTYLDPVGKVELYHEGGSVDGAWVETLSYVSSATNTLHTQLPNAKNLTVKNSMPYLIVGQRIGRVGNRTNAQTGIITNLNWSGKLCEDEEGTNCVNYTNMLYSDVLNGGGDSGGVAFVINGTSTSVDVIGIGIGGSKDPSHRMVISRMDNINNTWGLKRY